MTGAKGKPCGEHGSSIKNHFHTIFGKFRHRSPFTAAFRPGPTFAQEMTGAEAKITGGIAYWSGLADNSMPQATLKEVIRRAR
ncbi:MAG: hypothetical protein ACRD4P_11565 [Bryobacteraceae bacterium]